jgi:hypothetical protein
MQNRRDALTDAISSTATDGSCPSSHGASPDDVVTHVYCPRHPCSPDQRDVGCQGDDDKHSQDSIGVVLRLCGKGIT